jgi:hypothetical protein
MWLGACAWESIVLLNALPSILFGNEATILLAVR